MLYDVAVIGAGVIGTFVARELSKFDLRIALIEKDHDVSNGTSKSNSGLIHAGYDAKEGTLKAEYNRRGNSMYDEICNELDVPFKRIGSLVTARDQGELEHIRKLYHRGIKNGIPQLRILTAEEVRELEPNIDKGVIGALHAGTAGIIGPFELTIALAENAVDNGVDMFLDWEVESVRKEGGFNIQSKSGEEIRSKVVVNAAGVYADEINNMISSNKLNITPRRGQYFIFDKSEGKLVNSIIFQCPTKLGKGVIVTPTVHGNLLIGPNAENIEDKDGIDTTSEGYKFLMDKAEKTLKVIPSRKIITSFSGLRAVEQNGDFVIGEAEDISGFINAAGIQSPGLSSAPAIAEDIVGIVKEIIPNMNKKDKFIQRRKQIRFTELTDHEKKELIKKDRRYGNIVCRCECVTEGEIVDAINRNAGGNTLDGLKRRVRPGMGRCQGGFCTPRIIELLARELNIEPEEVVKSSVNSKILFGESKNNDAYKNQDKSAMKEKGLQEDIR